MGSPFRVVLIDDDPDLRTLIELTLQFTAGWEVITADNGVDGIEAVGRVAPDVVVVDLMMPGLDGFEVCRRLKGDPKTAPVPVVFLTARKHLDDAKVQSVGAAGVIVKPFETETLSDRIRELCEGNSEFPDARAGAE
jgi:DNA-binding response OmpR family regulator